MIRASLLATALWLSLIGAAVAQTGAPTSCSGTATGTAAAVPFPASGAHGPTKPQLYVTIVNASSDIIWVNPVGGAAAVGTAGSMPLTATGGSVTWFAPQFPPPGTISIISAGTSSAYTCAYQ